MIEHTDYVLSWKSKGLSAETIKPPTTSDNSLTPAVSYYSNKTRVNFFAKISYTHGKVVNIYIVFEVGASRSPDDDPTLKTCLFGAVTLTLILISMGIQVMELALIQNQVFHFQVVDLVKI